MDWITWANFCDAYPQFGHHNQKKEDGTLKLSRYTYLPRILVKNFRRVRDVIIDGDPTSYRVEKKYRKLKNLEKVTIVNADTLADYITSPNIRELAVSLIRYRNIFYPNMHDPALPILKNSNHIETFLYFNGGLQSESLSYLRQNPIRKLTLYNVKIQSSGLYKKFLLEAEQLTNLKLLGRKSIGTQLGFLNGPITARERLKTLSIQLLNEISHFSYGRQMGNCKNLEHLTIIYSHPNFLEGFLDNFSPGKNLKTITLKTHFIDLTDSIGTMVQMMIDDCCLIQKLKEEFAEKNVELIQNVSYEEDFHKTLVDRIMTYKNEQ